MKTKTNVKAGLNPQPLPPDDACESADSRGDLHRHGKQHYGLQAEAQRRGA